MKWRVGRHRAAIWKSLVLPAGGAALCWLLLMTLWMPLLDFARSYAPLVRRVEAIVKPADCIETFGLSTAATLAALPLSFTADAHGSRRTTGPVATGW